MVIRNVVWTTLLVSTGITFRCYCLPAPCDICLSWYLVHKPLPALCDICLSWQQVHELSPITSIDLGYLLIVKGRSSWSMNEITDQYVTFLSHYTRLCACILIISPTYIQVIVHTCIMACQRPDLCIIHLHVYRTEQNIYMLFKYTELITITYLQKKCMDNNVHIYNLTSWVHRRFNVP